VQDHGGMDWSSDPRDQGKWASASFNLIPVTLGLSCSIITAEGGERNSGGTVDQGRNPKFGPFVDWFFLIDSGRCWFVVREKHCWISNDQHKWTGWLFGLDAPSQKEVITKNSHMHISHRWPSTQQAGSSSVHPTTTSHQATLYIIC
jgi:hypothetical protein